MATPSQTGKVPPRVIEGRTDDRKSARGVALCATAAVSVAAVCALVALLTDAVSSSEGAQPSAGISVAGVVSVAPLVVVAILSIVGVAVRPAFAGAVTAGYGAVAVGLTVIDASLIGSPIDSNRLELFMPTTAEALTPAMGSYLLLAAHALAVLGGIFGLATMNRASFGDGYGHSANADLSGRATAVRVGSPLAFLTGTAALVGAVTMFAPPYDSTDSIVLVPAVVEAPLATSVGSGVVALALLVVISAALASISPTVASGATLGAGLGLLGIAGARVLAGGDSGPTIDASSGAVAGAVVSVVIVVVGLSFLPVAALRERRSGPARIERSGALEGGSVFMRWHVVAGLLGAAAGVLLLTGGLLPVLEVPDGLPNPTILATRTTVVAGFILVVSSVPMFFSMFAATVRPALGVLAVAGVMAASGVLQSLVLATDIDGISVGFGGIATAVGVLVAFGCAAAVLLAGSAEREDVDTSDTASDRTVATVAGAGAILSVIGLGLPLYRGTEVTAASFFEIPWGWDAWGQALLAVTVLVGAGVAARSRPARGSALLVGSALALVVYVLGWPLTQGRALDPVVGPGVFAGALGGLILAVAAVLSARTQQK
ncbi:hypothetical protein QMK17_11355 [Rhodococcus sp. G-MC3]|uniref:hypothetical protein n=1 Tax=Rhodococcus sp. G-MC3 TaxID=3046209 RepID=UPI0024B992BD|nr:hypothetical protein [Rhodococcus sp. G-MC3]MDJ0393927.1 hypothetical protein [Rhodococcus sp. G-MC3]